jgi:hypothetical protein
MDKLLSGSEYNELPAATRGRIEEIDMDWIMDVLPRNLRVLMGKIGRSARKS